MFTCARLGALCLIAGITACLATVTLPVAAHADPAVGVAFHVRFYHSRLCLDIPSASFSDRIQLQQYYCIQQQQNQRWRLELAVFDYGAQRQYYRIRSALTGKCVTIDGYIAVDRNYYALLSDGTRVVQYTCSPNWTSQWFTLVSTDRDGYYKVRNYHTEKCLNVSQGSTSIQAPVIQYACGGYWFQGDDNMKLRFFLY